MTTELDITGLLPKIAPRDYSASVAELGDNAGKATWAAACEDALELFGPLFDRASFDDYFRQWGAWSDDEIAAHSDSECAALMLQFISGDIRECDWEEWGEQWSDEWWAEYEKASAAGQVCGRLGRGDDGRIYYYIGS